MPSAADGGSRRAAVPALGHRRAASRGAVVAAARGPSGGRRLSGPGQPRLPGVLHLLPAPDPGVASHAVGREHRRRARVSLRASSASRTSSSAIRCSPRIESGASRSATRFEPAGSPSASSARRGSIGSTRPLIDALHRAGLAAISFGVETRLGRDAEAIRPAADSARAAAPDHRRLPAARHRHGGVLRVRVPAGRLVVDCRDDRLCDRSGIDRGAVQAADAVPGDADVAAAGAAGVRDRTGSGSTATRRRSRTRR